ncbi:NTP transferase domain-containing protein [Paenibacillus phytohabitans]|uniref:NTP transferase domain-containing protein n=1 Tax=Paenibacillus phytohabitans TaxID=2654978 RepID=UPI0014924905|nr:NTP transferase domain-containing protein [Paenibacillus phytohabitans]
MKVAGIYLAASRSKEAVAGSGSLKQPDGITVGAATLSELERCGLDPLIVVVRADDPLKWMPPGSSRSSRRTETCLTAHLGLSFSLRCGLNAISSLQPDAVVIAQADQPFIPAALVNRLTDAFVQNPGLDYVASINEGVVNPPVLFAKSVFPELQALDSDRGLSAIFQSSGYKGMMLQSDSERNFTDAELPVSFGELRREWSVPRDN